MRECKPWTNHQIRRLKEMYDGKSPTHEELLSAFPGRTIRSITHCANANRYKHARYLAKDGIHPLITQLDKIITKENIYYTKTFPGTLRFSIARWRKGRGSPTLSCFDKALNILGYELVVRKKDDGEIA